MAILGLLFKVKPGASAWACRAVPSRANPANKPAIDRVNFIMNLCVGREEKNGLWWKGVRYVYACLSIM